MRLWHYDVLDLLPKSQLLAQWRELNSIFAKEDRHILINYVYEYPKSHLYHYTTLVLTEMKKRHIQIRTVDKMNRYFEDVGQETLSHPFPQHHDTSYFEICFYNLKEKFLRGQKDYERAQFEALAKRLHAVQQQKDMI